MAARYPLVPVAVIAQATHEANRSWCAANGDDSQLPWGEAPEWQRESALAGVRAVLAGTASTPEEQHVAWCVQKHHDGWTYGEVKDAEARTHPCLVAYDDLPPVQQLKDSIFRAIVTALSREA